MKTASIILFSFSLLWACSSPEPEPVVSAVAPASTSSEEHTISADPGDDAIVFAAPIGDAWELFTFLPCPNRRQTS